MHTYYIHAHALAHLSLLFGVLSEHYREFRQSLTVKCFDEIVHEHSRSVTDNLPRIRRYPV